MSSESEDLSTAGGGVSAAEMQKHLSLFVSAVNSDLTTVGLAKKIELKDFESLDSDTFVKLIKYLLYSSQIYTYEQFNNTVDTLSLLRDEASSQQMPPVSFDAHLDYVYWAVKRIFPRDNDTFTYFLLLNPHKNPKATKLVIAYLTQFALFADNWMEAFDKIRHKVLEESSRRKEAHAKNADLRDKINQLKKENREKRELVPALEEKLAEVNLDLQHAEEEYSELEAEVHKYKKIYEKEEDEKIGLEHQLHEINQERLKLESQIVKNPAQILNTFEIEKVKLAKLIEERDLIGARSEKLSHEDIVMEKLIDKANISLTQLQNCMYLMEDAEGKAVEHNQLSLNVSKMKAELSSLEANLKFMIASFDKNKIKMESDVQFMKSKMNSIHEKITTIKQQSARISEFAKMTRDSIKLNLEPEKEKISKKIEKNRKELALNYEWLESLPLKIKNLEDDTELEQFMDKFLADWDLIF